MWWSAFAAYFLVITVISVWAGHFVRQHADYILAGRRLGSWTTALGLSASDMSGWLMMGLPGAVYSVGLEALWMPCSLLLGAYLTWTVLATRLRVRSEVLAAVTIPSFIAAHFKSHQRELRYFSIAAAVFFFNWYAAAGFISGAKMGALLFGLNHFSSGLVCFGILLLFTQFGGFLGLNWIDLFQGLFLLVALWVVPLTVSQPLWGTTPLWQLTDLTHALVPSLGLAGFFHLLGWGLGYFGQPHLLMRLMAIGHTEEMEAARRISLVWMLAALSAAIFIGCVGRLHFQDLADAELVFILLVEQWLHPILQGLVMAAVWCAIVSALAAQVMASASALSHDLYQTVRHSASQPELMLVNRLAVIGVAGFALWTAQLNPSSILQQVELAWSGLGATFGPVILALLFFQKLSALTALAGLIGGSAGVLFCGVFYTPTVGPMIVGYVSAVLLMGFVHLVERIKGDPQ